MELQGLLQMELVVAVVVADMGSQQLMVVQVPVLLVVLVELDE
jgi:hypothetical protein